MAAKTPPKKAPAKKPNPFAKGGAFDKSKSGSKVTCPFCKKSFTP